MARLNTNHKKLTGGVGKCSVPMWANGGPAGFCDDPAFGERPHSPTRYLPHLKKTVRDDNRYSGYVPGLACPAHGGPDTAEDTGETEGKT